jgi:hypothetical protein
MNISDLQRRVLAGKKPAIPLLDEFPNAAAAYSLRLLSSSYTGNCIEVRRSSDNALQNIGFVNGVLDTASLLSFVGAGDGFVRTWYDQSGNGRNLLQTNTSLQPQVVNLGTLYFQNEKQTVYFNNKLLIASVPLQNQPNSFYTVHRIEAPTGGKNIFDGTPDNQRNAFFTGSTSNYRLFAGIQYSSSFFPTLQLELISSLFNFSNSFISRNGVSGIIGDPGNQPTSSYRLGGLINSNFFGDISEFITYNSDQSANRTAIESNINAYYNIF